MKSGTSRKSWRANRRQSLVDGRVYSADDSGNLYIADAETGKLIGGKPVKLIGTIVRSTARLYADGKIYLCSTTAWHVMQPTDNGVKFLDKMRLPEQDEVSGSLAVSHGKTVCARPAQGCIAWETKMSKPSTSAIRRRSFRKRPRFRPAISPPGCKLRLVELLLKPGQKHTFKCAAV